MTTRMEQLFMSPGFRLGAALVRELEAQRLRNEGQLADAATEAARAQAPHLLRGARVAAVSGVDPMADDVTDLSIAA